MGPTDGVVAGVRLVDIGPVKEGDVLGHPVAPMGGVTRDGVTDLAERHQGDDAQAHDGVTPA